MFVFAGAALAGLSTRWSLALGWLRSLKALHPHVQRFAPCQSRLCSDVLLLESRTLAAMRLGVFPLTGGRS